MPYFVLCSYIMAVIYGVVRISHVSGDRAIVLDVVPPFGWVYTIFDILLMGMAILLITRYRKTQSGVMLLMIGRLIHRLLFSVWTLLFYFVFDDAFDLGCLLILLATKMKEEELQGSRTYELILLIGRLCMCLIYLFWMEEDASIYFKLFGLVLMSFLAFGYRCKVLAFLTVVGVLHHDVFSHHWSLWYGWNDAFLTLLYFSNVFSKLGAFMMLWTLGGGRWSIDGYLSGRDKKGNYELVQNETTA
ncbi:hypothetical protein KR018_000184, partial [Drosophila ironensis]